MNAELSCSTVGELAKHAFFSVLECQEYDEQRLRRERRKENKRKMVVGILTLS